MFSLPRLAKTMWGVKKERRVAEWMHPYYLSTVGYYLF